MRRGDVAATLSLFDPKLQKRLLALHSAIDTQAFLKSAVQLVQAAIPCDVLFSLLHNASDGGCSSAVWGADCSIFKEEYLRTSLVGDRHLSILAGDPSAKTCRLSGCFPSEEKTESFPFTYRPSRAPPCGTLSRSSSGMRRSISSISCWRRIAELTCRIFPPPR